MSKKIGWSDDCNTIKETARVLAVDKEVLPYHCEIAIFRANCGYTASILQKVNAQRVMQLFAEWSKRKPVQFTKRRSDKDYMSPAMQKVMHQSRLRAAELGLPYITPEVLVECLLAVPGSQLLNVMREYLGPSADIKSFFQSSSDEWEADAAAPEELEPEEDLLPGLDEDEPPFYESAPIVEEAAPPAQPVVQQAPTAPPVMEQPAAEGPVPLPVDLVISFCNTIAQSAALLKASNEMRRALEYEFPFISPEHMFKLQCGDVQPLAVLDHYGLLIPADQDLRRQMQQVLARSKRITE